MGSKNNPKVRQTEIVVQELKDEVLIYDLTVDKAYCLNETSAMVWNLCDGKSSVSDIAQELSKKLKQPVKDDLVWLAIDQLKKDGLLSNSEEIAINFDGLSRREVIRKVGFASMVALPVIASLIAPTAAMAQSGAAVVCTGGNRPLQCTCATNNQCSTNNCTTGSKRCCVAGVNSFAGGPGSGYCTGAPGNICDNRDCCSGVINNLGPATCGGAGDRCVCA